MLKKEVLLAFEAHNMLTNSQRHLVEVSVHLLEGGRSCVNADITCLDGGGSDGWYDVAEAFPEEVSASGDIPRIKEFLQDVLLSVDDVVWKNINGIRSDPHGLLDFLFVGSGECSVVS